MDPANVDGPVLAGEAADAAHVVAVVAELVAPKAVDIRVEDVVEARQPVQIVAVLALGAGGKQNVSNCPSRQASC